MAQPVILRYTHNDTTVELKAFYDRGLEGQFLPGVEQGSVVLTSYEPFWHEREWNAHVFNSTILKKSITTSHILARIDGVWKNLNNPGTGTPNEMLIDEDGTLYVGGDFTDWGGDLNADYIAKYDGSSWSALGSGLNGQVWDIERRPGGGIYVAGDFTDAGGDANADIVAQWDGSSWSALGNPTGGTLTSGRSIIVARDGTIYLGGDFLNLGGDANADYIAQYDGSSWSAVSTSVPNGRVNVVREAPNGDIFIGGAFTDVGTSGASYVAYWDGSSWNSLGSGGPSGEVYDIAIADDEIVYVVGAFNDIYEWNGVRFRTVPSGPTGGTKIRVVRFIPWPFPSKRANALWYWALSKKFKVQARDAGVFILVAGDFTGTENNDATDKIGIWNRHTWSPLDVDLPAGATVTSVARGPLRPDLKNYDIYIGYDATGSVSAGFDTTVSYSGSAPTYPVLSVKRSGGTEAVLESLINETSGHQLILNLRIMDGETVEIDLRPWKKTITSDYRGNLLGKVASLSDLGTWALLPGDNLVRIYVRGTGSPTFTGALRWQNTYWSVDDL